MAHQPVHRRAQRRVGADATVAVGAAALQAHGDVAGRHRLALHAVGFFEHPLHQLDAACHRLGGTAGVLDAEAVQPAAFLQAFLLHQPADLVGLAAQPHQQQCTEVGMPCVTAERAAQDLQRLAFAVGGAAGAVRQRHHAVDVGVAFQRPRVDVATEVVGNGPRHRGRAVDAGQHADVVARGHAPVGPHDALEGGRLGDVLRGRDA